LRVYSFPFQYLSPTEEQYKIFLHSFMQR
jgi:hypothetical protein